METYKELINQGLYLVANNDFKNAKKMFLKCIEVAPNSID